MAELPPLHVGWPVFCTCTVAMWRISSGRTNQNEDLVEHNEPIHGAISCSQLFNDAKSDTSVTLRSVVQKGSGT